MEARAIATYVRISPRKANQVLRSGPGPARGVGACRLLTFTPKHVAREIG